MSLNNEKSPTSLKLKGDLKNNIRKLNKIPLWIAGSILAIVLLVVMYSLNSRAIQADQNETEQTIINPVDPNKMADKVYNDFIGQADKNKTDDNLSMPIFPENPEDSNFSSMHDLSPEDKILAEKMKKTNEAMYAPTSIIAGTNNFSQVAAATTTGITDVAQQITTPILQQKTKDSEANEFLDKSKKSFDYLQYSKTKQLSPYEIKTGSVIPGVLISGINSELPGMIIGQTSDNVYDSATGKHLLIPQGTRLVGTYSAGVQYGQSRALVAWNRIVFPDGQTLNIEAMNGTDQAGYAGFEDKVDNHYLRIFGSALLISIISGEMTYSNGKVAVNQNPNQQETSISQIGNTMLEKNLAVAPTIKIRPGYQFNIFVTKDMILEPLQKVR